MELSAIWNSLKDKLQLSDNFQIRQKVAFFIFLTNTHLTISKQPNVIIFETRGIQ